MAVTYTVQVSDADYKALAYVAEDINQYVDDTITGYILQMKNDMVKHLIKTELAKPGVRTIPADPEVLIAQANIKTAKQREEEDTKRIEQLVSNPDAPEIDIGESAFLPDGQ